MPDHNRHSPSPTGSFARAEKIWNFPHLQIYTLYPLLVSTTPPSSSQIKPSSTYIDRTKMPKVCLEEAQTCELATRVPAEMTDARAHLKRSHMGQRGGPEKERWIYQQMYIRVCTTEPLYLYVHVLNDLLDQPGRYARKSQHSTLPSFLQWLAMCDRHLYPSYPTYSQRRYAVFHSFGQV